MPRMIYEKFIKEYNEKQWGVPADAMSAELCKRFDVRLDDEPRLKPDCRLQGIPEQGYAEWTKQIVAGVPVILNFDYLQRRNEIRAAPDARVYRAGGRIFRIRPWQAEISRPAPPGHDTCRTSSLRSRAGR